MTTIDNSKIFYDGVYTDVTVLVPANTTYKRGTVLGRNADKKLTAYTSDVASSQPLYILAQPLENTSDSAVEVPMVRVFDGGVVDKSKLIFAKEADATSTTVLDAMKTNNFRLVLVEDYTTTTNLAE